MSPSDFRTWLAGYLEGLAGRELPASQIDVIIRRFQDVYRGGGAIEAPAAEVVLNEATPTQKKYPPRVKKTAAAPVENSTPVAETPPYNPDEPQVVRLG